MKVVLTGVAMVLTYLVLTGMGGLGGTPEGTIPETKENIQARVADRTDTVTELSRVSVEGNIFLEGSRGSGKLTIPFREIQEIVFAEQVKEETQAQIRLKSGQTIQLAIRNRSVLYGDTGFGAFQIRIRDIKKIELLEP